MTQIKIISENTSQALEEGVNKFLYDQREIISSVIDVKFETREKKSGLPGAVSIYAYIIYSVI